MIGQQVEFVCSDGVTFIKSRTRGVIKHVYTHGPYAFGVLFDGQTREIAMKQDEVWLM